MADEERALALGANAQVDMCGFI